MQFPSGIPSPDPVAVIDVGSNSVRLVVYDQAKRAPIPVFNEKVLCGLGRGLDSTGRLNPDGAKLALQSVQRFAALAKAMNISDIDAFATAAVREAMDGSQLVTEIESNCGFPVQIISGEEEARLSGLGVLSEIPEADGFMADLGGASLELARLDKGLNVIQTSLPIGPLRNPKNENQKDDRKGIQDKLSKIYWLAPARESTLYAVGGAWRSWARMHMKSINYPLSVIHHYRVPLKSAIEFSNKIAQASANDLRNFSGFPPERAESIPFANFVLQRLIKQTKVSSVIFSAYGAREGLIFNRLAASVKVEDPLIAACHNLAAMTGRTTVDGETLYKWTSAIFSKETSSESRLRRAACLLADLEWSDHPDYRAQHALLRILRYPLIGIDHPGRAYVALAVASRHAKVSQRIVAKALGDILDKEEFQRARAAGLAIRLAYTFSGGVTSLLEQTHLYREKNKVTLKLPSHASVLVGNVVQRRFKSLAKELDCEPTILNVNS